MLTKQLNPNVMKRKWFKQLYSSNADVLTEKQMIHISAFKSFKTLKFQKIRKIWLEMICVVIFIMIKC